MDWEKMHCLSFGLVPKRLAMFIVGVVEQVSWDERRWWSAEILNLWFGVVEFGVWQWNWVAEVAWRRRWLEINVSGSWKARNWLLGRSQGLHFGQTFAEVLSEEGRGLVVGGLLMGERPQLRGTLAYLLWGDIVQAPVLDNITPNPTWSVSEALVSTQTVLLAQPKVWRCCGWHSEFCLGLRWLL